MAIQDFGGSVNGEAIKPIAADHMHKPDPGPGLVRKMPDAEKVGLLQGVDNSAVAPAVSDLIKDKPVRMIHGASASKLTNENCLPNRNRMRMNPSGLSRAVTMPLVKQGKSRWFFIAVEYAFGHDPKAKGIAFVNEAGGKVVATVRHVPNSTDISAFRLGAQSRGATTLGMATFGNRQNTIVKRAEQFGLAVTLVPCFMGDTDIKATGSGNRKGALQFCCADNDATRAFAEPFRAKSGRPPTFTNAKTCQMRTHYLKAVAAVRRTDAGKVQARMAVGFGAPEAAG